MKLSSCHLLLVKDLLLLFVYTQAVSWALLTFIVTGRFESSKFGLFLIMMGTGVLRQDRVPPPLKVPSERGATAGIGDWLAAGHHQQSHHPRTL